MTESSLDFRLGEMGGKLDTLIGQVARINGSVAEVYGVARANTERLAVAEKVSHDNRRDIDGIGRRVGSVEDEVERVKLHIAGWAGAASAIGALAGVFGSRLLGGM